MPYAFPIDGCGVVDGGRGIIARRIQIFSLPYGVLARYRYLSHQADTIVRAYGITVLTTVVGTVVSLFITSMMALRSFPERL